MAKIERTEAVENIDSIIETPDDPPPPVVLDLEEDPDELAVDL